MTLDASTGELFVATAPGLEPLTRREVEALLPGAVLDEEPGGLRLTGTLATAFLLNLHLRTASRVLLRLARVRVTRFDRLERAAGRVDWSRVVAPDGAVTLAVTCRKSRLYHSGAVAQRLADAVTRQLPGVRVVAGAAESDAAESDDAAGTVDPGAPTRIVARLVRDHLTLSADTSGAHLHRRGWRRRNGPAPLRETVAAALLLAADWDGSTPLLDPVCGSGTVLIEAAGIATRRPPGLGRRFACEAWSGFDRDHAHALRAQARAGVRPAPAALVGGDRDPRAVDAVRVHADAAGVGDDVRVEAGTVARASEWIHGTPGGGRGLVAANPPWGLRLGDEDRLRNLYAALGRLARDDLGGWRAALVCPSERLAAATGLGLQPRVRLRQGGVNLALWIG